MKACEGCGTAHSYATRALALVLQCPGSWHRSDVGWGRSDAGCAAVQGKLAAVDVGSRSALHAKLLMPGLELVRTVQEEDFGTRLFDVNYFHSLSARRPAQRLFICN